MPQLRDDGSVENSSQRFLNLTVRGFRRLAKVDLELRPLTVLIGANGVGKSSLLDALSILASSAQGNLNAVVSEMSGLAAMMTYDRTSEVGFGISMTVPSYETLEYFLSLRPQGSAYLIGPETLQQRRQGYPHPFVYIDSHGTDIKYFEVDQGRLVRPNWEHNPLESSLSQVPKLFRAPEEFRHRLASSTFYHLLNVEPRSPVRLP
jgi:predicted ATPase